MNDIQWREFTEGNWALIELNPNATVLVETPIDFRVSRAKYLVKAYDKPWLIDNLVGVAIRFAFIN